MIHTLKYKVEMGRSMIACEDTTTAHEQTEQKELKAGEIIHPMASHAH